MNILKLCKLEITCFVKSPQFPVCLFLLGMMIIQFWLGSQMSLTKIFSIAIFYNLMIPYIINGITMPQTHMEFYLSRTISRREVFFAKMGTCMFFCVIVIFVTCLFSAIIKPNMEFKVYGYEKITKLKKISQLKIIKSDITEEKINKENIAKNSGERLFDFNKCNATFELKNGLLYIYF